MPSIIAPCAVFPSPAQGGAITGRLHFLDAIRGLAALCVVGSHYVAAYGLPGPTWALTFTPLHIWWDGAAAVSLFFVLSGLVLSRRYFGGNGGADLSKLHIPAYAVSRVCRIWLPYAAILVVSIAARATFKGIPSTDPAASPWLLSCWPARHALAALRELNLLNMYAFGRAANVPQAWTLAIEMIFSLLIPVAVMVAARSSWLLFVSVVLIVKTLDVSPFCFHFAIGVLLAKHYVTWGGRVSAVRGGRSALLVVGLALYTIRYTLPVFLGLDNQTTRIWCITGMGAACLLLYVLGSQRARSVLSIPLLRGVGQNSYSIYLIHLAVLLRMTPPFLRALNGLGVGGRAAWALGLVATIAVTIVLAAACYRLIEQPSIRLGRYLAGRMQGERGSVRAPAASAAWAGPTGALAEPT